MNIKITSKRQVTFPRRVMETLQLKAGDRLDVVQTREGILLKPHRFNAESFAPLKEKIRKNLPSPDVQAIRHARLDPNLRDWQE